MTLERSISLGLSILAVTLACEKANPGAASSPEMASNVIRAAHIPPSAKDVIAAAFQSASVPLTVDESCRNAGTEQTDVTLGQYLAGFAAELAPDSGKNGLVTSVEESADGWVCRLMIQRRAGEEVWSWGLEFAFDKSGVLIPRSYRCIGAG